MQEDKQGGHAKGEQPSRERETRLQQGGEGGTTRFGMEEGDNTDVPARGGPTSDEDEAEGSPS